MWEIPHRVRYSTTPVTFYGTFRPRISHCSKSGLRGDMLWTYSRLTSERFSSTLLNLRPAPSERRISRTLAPVSRKCVHKSIRY